MNGLTIWVDDIRPVPANYTHWCKSVDECINLISKAKLANIPIDVIDLDHDAGDYAEHGGDYIRLLDWLEATKLNDDNHTAFRIHTMNPVGKQQMINIIQHNGWTLL